jgi:hypothetical protein
MVMIHVDVLLVVVTDTVLPEGFPEEKLMT